MIWDVCKRWNSVFPYIAVSRGTSCDRVHSRLRPAGANCHNCIGHHTAKAVDPQLKPAPVILAPNQICLLLANEAPSSILCPPSYLSIFQCRTCFSRIHFTRFIPLRFINNKPHRQSIIFAVSALFNSIWAEFPFTGGNSLQVPNNTQESTKDGTEKWTQHSSDI